MTDKIFRTDRRISSEKWNISRGLNDIDQWNGFVCSFVSKMDKQGSPAYEFPQVSIG